jgi:hypothetical protein
MLEASTKVDEWGYQWDINIPPLFPLHSRMVSSNVAMGHFLSMEVYSKNHQW